MANLKDTIKGAGKRIKGQVKEPWKIDPIGHAEETLDDITGAFTPKVPVPEEETIIPIPDQKSASLEARRRRAKGARTGRDSTILTEGLGG